MRRIAIIVVAAVMIAATCVPAATRSSEVSPLTVRGDPILGDAGYGVELGLDTVSGKIAELRVYYGQKQVQALKVCTSEPVNHENFRTGSLWGGYHFTWGETWQFQVTAMVGGVFGQKDGIAPGCGAPLAWKELNFSISNEYVFDTTSKSGNFYYVWAQITYQPLKWVRVGYAGQRNRVFQLRSVISRGFLSA